MLQSVLLVQKMARRSAAGVAAAALMLGTAVADSDLATQGSGTKLSTVATSGLSYNDGFPLADQVIVEKKDRKLHLLKAGEILRTFDVALGPEPSGHKEAEGDNRTPEGKYWLDMRNPNSEYFLSIRISYPNEEDRRRAKQKGVHPGGQIMIHGQPNSPTWSAAYYRRTDWTNGCIAVSNSDMIDIWLMTPGRVPIEILP